MAIWRWITDRLYITKGIENWRAIYGRDDDSGEPVTPESALKLSAWWSCTRLISGTIATLPGAIIEKKGEERINRQDHPLYGLLTETPNDWQTPVEFWEGRIAPICTVGNSYAEKKFLGDRLVALHPLKADAVAPNREDDGRLVYRVSDRGKSSTLPADKVFHIRGFGFDDIEGLSPVGFAARSLGGALAADRAAARTWGKGLRASGYWKPPTEMTSAQRDQFFDNYIKPGSGIEGQGRGIVVPPGFEWASMNISPKDAELLLTRGFNVSDVCRWMGVPPILVGHAAEGQTMWGSGVEQIILGWLVLGLREFLKRIEAAVNLRLVAPAERGRIKFEFNFEGLLRADSAGRAALMSTLAQNGLRTRDELRKVDNLPPMPGGDQLTVQSNLVPLDRLGAQQANAETVRNALRSWLIEEREERTMQ